MATTSFAVGSVSVAIVWGTFFYPPPAKQVQETVQPAPVITPQANPAASGVQLASHALPAAPAPAMDRMVATATPHGAQP